MSKFVVKHVAVLGAGVMGAQIAAHLANAGVPVTLFDLAAPEGDRNGIVKKALAGLRKLEPAPLAGAARLALITPANYDDHLDRLQGCDLIIEAIAERMDWKTALYERIAPHVAPSAIIASNTSGLSIDALARALPESLRHRFCGVHFFNPPRYMRLVEIIATPHTRPAVLDQLETWLTSKLGKGVVRALDTPNFIGNRIGVFSILSTIHHTAPPRAGLRRGRRLTGQDRPAQERHLPHLRRGRPGHAGPRGGHHGEEPAGRPLASLLRAARLAVRPDRQGRAGPEDRRRHLPQAGPRHPGAGPEGAGLRAQRGQAVR